MTKAGAAGLLLAAAVAAGPAAAQQLAVTRVRIDSLPQLESLARAGFEVSSVERRGAELYALIVATEVQRAALAVDGLSAAPVAPQGAPAADHFRDFPGVQAALEGLVAAGRPVTLDTLGVSVEGRPILALKIGPADDAPDRPNVLYLGTHHAREWIAAEVALRLAEYLADSLAATAAGAALLGARDVWVVPVVNPDGYQYTFTTERLWRKNRRPNADGTFGVDLNRNYPAFWGRDEVGSSGTPGAETYRGTGPASEPEIAAIIAFHAVHPPDVAVSYHSYTGLILYPYGHAPGAIAPDDATLAGFSGTPLAPAIEERLPETSRPQYFPGPGWMLYPTNGEYTDWAYRSHGTMAYTVEMTAGCCTAGQPYGFVFPDDSAAVAQVFADNLPFALSLLEGAGLDGAQPPGTRVESAWPEIRLTAAPGAGSRTVEVRSGGTAATRTLVADSLDRGRRSWRWRGPLDADPAGAELRAADLGLTARIVLREGAETDGGGWSGWTVDSTVAVEGRRSWRGANDTLVSPTISAPGLRDARLVFWTRHQGSLFLPDRFGLVEVSLDGGGTWTSLARVEGSAPEWYPVSLPLPAADGARVRFVSRDLGWVVDAIHVLGTPLSPAVQAAQGILGVSENPVRSGRVFFAWAPATGDARLSVFTFGGELVYRAPVPAGAGSAAWDLANSAGQTVSNGVYLAVLEVGGEVLRKRLFVARPR
ncbi:MAG TPA: M14 family zinc carboxypeptidase [Gemmatimonadales bacterium]|nr:M14 family zinc carboxypeptidase [Gemmatimonadales bacterium]